ncbi:MAG: gamma-glutamyl-gamma-aminobutyrate hydrolase family protein [Thermoleophilia bacterium]|nr:gamma-glutamyl-gamma-aminobutyrate hydrolase family protein [Thermoleophilia bacterium]
MSARPRILITGRHDARKGKGIQFVGELHVRLLVEAGALPMPVVIGHGMQGHLAELLRVADGLLITEGGDIGPALRSVANPLEIEELDPLKDEIEACLMGDALQRGLPVLGICRGAELMNVLLGGEIYEDLPTELGTTVVHLDYSDYHAHRHGLDIVPGTPLHEIYGTTRLLVTSYHHQGVERLAEPLEAMATGPDGLVEAFRHRQHPFAWGLQFHPERQQADHVAHVEIHRRFVEHARIWADAA